jgi:hypothetical protein
MFDREDRWSARSHNEIDFARDELGGQLRQMLAASVRPAILDREIAALAPADGFSAFSRTISRSIGCGSWLA